MARLVDRGIETVYVSRVEKVKTDLGTTTKHTAPVAVSNVSIQPVAADEEAGDTLSTLTLKVIGSGEWPGGAKSIISVKAGPYAGDYDQEGEARVHSMSPRTAHFVVRMTSRSREVK